MPRARPARHPLSASSAIWDRAATLVGPSTSVVVAGLTFVGLATQRDAVAVTGVTGALANGVASKVLKRVLSQERPTTTKDEDENSKSYRPSDKGMPSSHAMSLSFIGTYVAWHVGNVPLAVSMALYSGLSLVYRVRVAVLHTVPQVTVGVVLGGLHALLWYEFVLPHCRSWMEDCFGDGLLPYPYLVIPAAVGALTIGSVERNGKKWLKRLLR